MGSQVAVPPKDASGAAPGAASNPIMSFVPMAVVCAILYLLIIRPQQKQAKEHRRMVDNLKPGDKVLTQGGIYGTVVSLKGAVVQVKVAENVRMEFSRSAVTQVLTESVNGSGQVAPGERAP